MICKKPFGTGLVRFGCGQCLPCRINRRRIWTHRLLLEAKERVGLFVTLTYAKDPPELVPRDVTLWFKRLRERFPPKSVRYLVAGEYGDLGGRPHYHVALFGVPLPGDHRINVLLRRSANGKPVWECQCETCRVLRETWGLGFVEVRELCKETAQYLAGYCMKKLLKRPGEDGRAPAFVRMSLRPGIGAEAMVTVSARLLPVRDAGVAFADVPTALAHGRRMLPLGRYLMRVLRDEMDFTEVGAQPGWEAEAARELLELYQAQGCDTARFVALVEGQRRQAAMNCEVRAKIHEQRRTL